MKLLREYIRETLRAEMLAEASPEITTVGHLRDAIAAAQGKKRDEQGKGALKDLA